MKRSGRDITVEQIQRLLKIVDNPEVSRNWPWLVDWLNGQFPADKTIMTGGHVVTVTAANVVALYEDDMEWKGW